MKTIKFFSYPLLFLGLFFLPQYTMASTLYNIGVFRNNSESYKIFDAADGSELSSGDLTDNMETLITADFDVANLLSNDGLEWQTETTDGTIGIHDQLFSLIDQFNVFTNYSRPMTIAVGNISTDYEGPEIVVCKSHSTTPRLKVFSYSEGIGEEKILGFKPFGDGADHNRGCSELGVGDLDDDNDNEIITFRGHERGGPIQVKIFDNSGNLETSFEISESIYEWSLDDSHIGKMKVANINSSGADEIIFQGDAYTVYAYGEDGNQKYEFDSYQYNGKSIKKIDVADIDGDGVAEVVIQQVGKKVPILILNSQGEVETSYDLYPDATTKAARFMFLGDFSTEL